MADQFEVVPTANGAMVSLSHRAMLRKKPIPFIEWSSCKAVRSTAARLGRMVSDGLATVSDDGLSITVPHDQVVRFGSSLAEQVGMPPIASASCQIDATGRIDQADTRITLRWRDVNFTEVRPNRNGVFLRYGDRNWRVGATVYALLDAIEAFNITVGADPMERIGAWGSVQSALSDATGQEVAADTYLRSLTIFQAGSFALEIAETPTGPDFLPVLMARSKLLPDRDETIAPDGSDQDQGHDDVRDEGADALLPPQLQQEFSRRRFASDSGVASAYVLGRNTFVVLEPSLKAALRVVHQKRLAPEGERREFLRNPRTFISSVLGEDDGGSGMFVETQQYSAHSGVIRSGIPI